MKLKWPKLLTEPPRLETIRTIDYVVAAGLAGIALWAHHNGNNITAMVDALGAGANLGFAISIGWQIRSREHFNAMSAIVDKVMQLNADLVSGKIEMMLQVDPDDERPSLH